MEPTAERNYSKLEWIIYIVILPLIFISILTITLLWFLDYDVKSKILMTLNQVPLIEKLIDDDKLIKEEISISDGMSENLKVKVSDLENTLTEKDSILAENEQKLIKQDEEIKKLNQQIEELQAQLQVENVSAQTRDQEIAELAKVYANMSAKSAANIISELGYEEAALVLGQMNTESKSKILEKMEPKQAADISILLKDQEYSKDKDIKALQERINILTNEIEELRISSN